MKKIRVMIADDHAILRMGLSSLLGRKGDFEIVGEAADGDEAVRKAQKLAPDVVIMDLMMPVTDGVEATRQIRERLPGTKVVILTTFGTADGIAHALSAGANGAVLKSTDFSDLVNAVRTVASGERYIAPDIRAILDSEPPVPDLTTRQTEILESIVDGLTNKEIAVRLGISLPMVKEHVKALFAKIGATNRSEAVATALRKHLLRM